MAYTSATQSGKAGAYVFNRTDCDGYVIVSADDAACPLLAYSDEGSFSATDMPEVMKWWLDGISSTIAEAAEGGVSYDASSAARAPLNRPAIAPLCTAKWDQGAPFNNLCPVIEGYRCPTGCVATAMAQILYSMKYPETTQGVAEYYLGQQLMSMDLEGMPLDWDKMQDVYGSSYTQDAANAVATLMKACGYATAMGYTAGTSGTLVGRIPGALRDYFKIDVNCRVIARLPYTSPEWEEIVYNNLHDCGPVIYNGQSNLGGHSFVCDGYDGNGYFHFNWGWAGSSNGYYLLGALGPEVQGYGGFAGGFNFDQQIIAGIQPPTGDPKIEYPDQLAQAGSTTAVVSSGTLRFNVTDNTGAGWSNLTDHDFHLYIGARFEPINGKSDDAFVIRGKYATLDELTLSASHYYSNSPMRIVVPLPDELADGDYKVTPVTWQADGDLSDHNDILCPPGHVNYVLLNASNNTFTVSNVDPKVLVYSNLETLSEIISGKSSKIKFTVTNNSDRTLSQCVAPVITSKGYLFKYLGTTMVVTLEPGETKDIESVGRFYDPNGNECNVASDTKYLIYLYDPTNKTEYRDLKTEVTVKPNDGSARLTLNSMGIKGVEKTKCTDTNSGINDSYEYVLETADDFTLDLNVNASGGLFDGRIELATTKVGNSDWKQLHASYPFFTPGNSLTFNAAVSHGEAEPNQHYLLKASYVINGYVYTLGNLYYVAKNASSIEQPEVAIEADTKFFNLQGIPVASPVKGEVYIRVTAGKAEKILF